MELDISGVPVRYQTGDHVAIYPENDEKEVEFLAEKLGIVEKLDTVFEMRALEGGKPKT
jgi:NADPH-ferrihemoprotein reductase